LFILPALCSKVNTTPKKINAMNQHHRILVIDDEAGICSLIRIMLEAEGYHISTANGGGEALALLNKHPFDLVISDLVMPDVTGLDVLAYVKKLSPETEFILITGYGTVESAVEALRHGAHDYITKPIIRDELKHSIKRALEYRHYRQERQQLVEALQERNNSLTQMLEASNRLAHLSPLPDVVLNEIPEIAWRQLGLKVAISVYHQDDPVFSTIIPDLLADYWWAQQLEQHQFTEPDLRTLFTGATRMGQAYLFNLAETEHPTPFAAPPEQPLPAEQLLAIPLDTRGSKITGVLWVTDIIMPPSTETVQLLEIFANQVAGTLESSQLFSNQLTQLRVRNTLVNAGQRIATMLDHKEVVNTVLDAALRVIPHVELAAVYYRTDLDADLDVVGLTSQGQRLTTTPIDPALVALALVDRLPVHNPIWQPHPDQPMRSLIIEPLTFTSITMGALAVISHKPNAFNDDLHQIVTMLANQAAIALQNASLYAEAQRVDEIEALYEAGKAIDRTLNLQETLTTTMAVSRSLTGASISNIYLYAGDNQRIDSVVTLKDEIELHDADRRRAAGLARDAAQNHQPDLIIEAQPPDQTIRAWLMVPLPSSGPPMGVLQLGSERPETFTQNDVRLMQIISSHAAAAIEKARLYEELQHRLQQTEALNAISQSISTTLQLDRVLELVVQSAAKTIVVATHSDLYLLNPNNDPHERETQVASQGPPLPAELVAVQKEAVQQAMQQRATVKITHQTRDQGAWSLLVAPLRVGEAVLGAISVKSPRPEAFHASDETLLNAFASHASIAIQNANLFRDLSSAYAEILRSHSTLKALFNGITDGLYITDRDLKIITINQAEAKRLGQTPDTLIGQVCDKLLWGEAAPALTKIVQETFQTGKEGIWESQTDADNRSLFAARNVHTYPIFTHTGEVSQVIIFAQDVSEQLRLQASLFRSANMAAVGQLASSVAHQINNPLTVIIANSQIMGMDANPNSPDYAMIQHIEEAGTQIRKIVQNLLDFSTQDSYEWFETDVAETIKDSLTLVSHSLRKNDIQIKTHIEDMPAIIASASHLKLLWMNLLLNARDAIADSHHNGLIEIRAAQIDANTVQVRLSDNGIGIPEQHRDRLFHPFFTTKTSGKNLGLGLFTCGAIVEFHQGQIELDNHPNAPGAVVTITLPINPTK